MSYERTFSVRLSDSFFAGLHIIKQRKLEEGHTNITRTDIIREALSLLFQHYGITIDELKEALEKLKTEGERKSEAAGEPLLELLKADKQ